MADNEEIALNFLEAYGTCDKRRPYRYERCVSESAFHLTPI